MGLENATLTLFHSTKLHFQMDLLILISMPAVTSSCNLPQFHSVGLLQYEI